MIRIVYFLLIVAAAYVECSNFNVLKCCPKGKGLNEKLVCENFDEPWEPVVYSPTDSILRPPLTIPTNFNYLDNTLPACNPSNYVYVNNQHQVVIFENTGSLYASYGNQEMNLQPGNYCVSPKGTIICLDEDSLEKRKKMEKNIRKCCRIDAIYSEEKNGCVARHNVSNKMNFLSEDTFIYSSFPVCDSREEFSISGELDEGYSLNMDGTLRTNASQPVVNYCVEYILEKPDEKPSIFTCAPRTLQDGDQNDIRFTLYPIGFFVSSFFLAITLISTFMLPGSYHALHWKCQTHYIVCLLIGDLLLGLTQISGNLLKETRFCTLNATAVHFFFLAAFFWLNTMCFNIWWTFRDFRSSVDKGQETYRLALYRLYAWGIPFIIVAIGLLMDQVLTEQYPAILRPKFGEKRCWFYGDSELFVYFLGPVGLLLVINLLLFVATTRELTCGLWKIEGVKSSTEKTALSHICLKLVIVMGITWVVDVLSWAIGGPKYIWYLTDLVNALQGVFIFIVVGCQPQIWNAVKRKWLLSDSSRNGSSNATPSVINDQPSTKQTVETLC